MKPHELTKEQLWELRLQIVLNSLFVHDYDNSLGIPAQEACDFFDGYAEYLWDLAEQDGLIPKDFFQVADLYDSPDNLYSWALCITDTP